MSKYFGGHCRSIFLPVFWKWCSSSILCRAHTVCTHTHMHFNTSSLHNHQTSDSHSYILNFNIYLTLLTIDQLFCHRERCSPLPGRIMQPNALGLWVIWLSISHFSRQRWLHTAVHRTSATTGRNIRERGKMREQSIGL